MIVLVCGDRDWDDELLMCLALDVCADECEEGAIPTIIEGGCRGADSMAGEIAYDNHWFMDEYEADWTEYGTHAGPIRNQQMLDEGEPDLVLAFHDDIEKSKGTKDMLRRAIKAGVPTMLIGHERVVTW